MRAVLGLVAGLAAGVVLESWQNPAATAIPEPHPFAVAVVREDSLLVPVARFDGRVWVPMWATPESGASRPASLTEIPREWLSGSSETPTAWHLWLSADRAAAGSPFDERRAVALAVTGVSAFGPNCSGVGLTTNFAEARPASPTRPAALIGVAVTSETMRVDTLAGVEPSSTMGLAVVEKAVNPFHRAEDDTIAREADALPDKPPPYRERRRVPVTWTRIARLGVAQGATKTFYFEGRKTYGPHLVMTGHVWLQMSAGRETADAEVDIDDAEGRMSVRREPLGTIRIADRVFWLFRAHGFDSAAFEIVELGGPGRPPSRILTVDESGC